MERSSRTRSSTRCPSARSGDLGNAWLVRTELDQIFRHRARIIERVFAAAAAQRRAADRRRRRRHRLRRRRHRARALPPRRAGRGAVASRRGGARRPARRDRDARRPTRPSDDGLGRRACAAWTHWSSRSPSRTCPSRRRARAGLSSRSTPAARNDSSTRRAAGGRQAGRLHVRRRRGPGRGAALVPSQVARRGSRARQRPRLDDHPADLGLRPATTSRSTASSASPGGCRSCP